MNKTSKRWIARALGAFTAFTGVAFVVLLLAAIWAPESSEELAENLTLTSMVLCISGGLSFMVGLLVFDELDEDE